MRAFFTTFVLSALFPIISVGIINYAIDPLQYFRQYERGTQVFFTDERLQNPGLARNYPYDTVIIGTSMTENFYPSYILAKTGWHTLKLSISGSTAYEQRKTLDVALRTGKVRRVIWGVQWDSVARPVHMTNTDMGGLPEYLYQDDWLGLLKNYLLSRSTLDRTIQVLRGHGETNLDLLNNWNKEYTFGCESIRAFLKDTAPARRIRLAMQEGKLLTTRTAMEENLKENLENVIKTHPEIEFIVFIPPSSAWFFDFISSIDPMLLDSFFQFRSLLAGTVSHIPNVQVYDFQRLEHVITDATHYKDSTHYSEEISKLMIDYIASHHALPIATQPEIQNIISSRSKGCESKEGVSRYAPTLEN